MEAVVVTMNGIACGFAAMGAVVTARRRPQEPAYIALTLLFVALVATFFLNIVMAASAGNAGLASLLQAPLQPILPVLFWFYVDDISSPQRREWKAGDLWHLIPAAIMLFACIFALSSREVEIEAALGWTPTDESSFAARALILAATAIWILQTSTYLAMSFNKLRRLKSIVRIHFGSTDARELTWLRVLTALIASSWAITVWYNTSSTSNATLEVITAMFALASTFALVLWGTRQSPALQANQFDGERLGSSSSEVTLYARSRLDDEHMARIEQRIRHAFEVDHVYRDPELSLSDLSKVLGVRPQYISQTLSRRMKSSFFDYCAQARISEACVLLRQTDQTVAQIALNVGFNSRSAFYAAFRLSKKMTPKAFRAAST
jgi:AraC-like DNA-binding protein